jgi:ribonucleoside-diphosphate reductase alpha chain
MEHTEVDAPETGAPNSGAKPKRLSSAEVSEYIWRDKYKSPEDVSVEDSFRRTASFIGRTEDEVSQFMELLSSRCFVPGGRIFSNAGTGRARATLGNCFFTDTVKDSMDGIFSLLRESALIMQAGGGIGVDFSGLRPKGAPVKGTGSLSSGPVSFAHMWDSMCQTIESAGSRRGAQMGVMRVDHPDIDLFIGSKKKDEMGANALQAFNLSVLVTDPFMDAVKNDLDWNLVFNGKVYRTVKARDLWDRIMKSNYNDWEPGVLFIDRLNSANNLYYCQTIAGCNPCGEQPLAPWETCNLGSFVLPSFIKGDPFLEYTQFDFEKLAAAVRTAVLFMDNVIDLNYYPLEQIKEQAMASRKVGLGVMGLTDALSMMTKKYASDEGRELAGKIMACIRDAAYSASVEIAKTKGAFPNFDTDKYLQAPFIKRLPEEIQEGIHKHGIRNSHLLTVAPTGTTSMFSGNVSSGVEPFFGADYKRSIRLGSDGGKVLFEMSPYAVELYRKNYGQVLPDFLRENIATLIPYRDHILMQSTAQRFIDSAISKTINFPESVSYEDFKEAYVFAYEAGCKGCTTYRPNSGKHGIIKTADATGGETADTNVLDVVPAEVLDGDLPGKRKKFKHPDMKHAYYLIFTHVESGNGKKRPAEMFINTKNQEHSEFTTALTRAISAIMRRFPDPSFLADELMEIQNNRTAFWHPKRRKMMPSLVAEIGAMMKEYFSEIGLCEPEVPIEAYAKNGHGTSGEKPAYAYCRKCGQDTLVKGDACEFCINPKCNYERCG